MKYLALLALIMLIPVQAAEYRVLSDRERDRDVPIKISYPVDVSFCTDDNLCPVAFLSSGYGVPYDKYSFVANTLNKAGYLVVAIQHELPGDPPLAVTGDLYSERAENWRRGVVTLNFVRGALKLEFTAYNFDVITLVGHSNGGDISAWAINGGADYAQKLITLDHRRVPLPRADKDSVLSIRGSDFSADDGVLYTPEELQHFEACIVTIADSKHNDMTDMGPEWLKQSIVNIMADYLDGRCYEPREKQDY